MPMPVTVTVTVATLGWAWGREAIRRCGGTAPLRQAGSDIVGRRVPKGNTCEVAQSKRHAGDLATKPPPGSVVRAQKRWRNSAGATGRAHQEEVVMRTAVVIGNPKPRSRTADAGIRVATELTGSPPETVVDVVDLGPALLGWGDPEVAAAIEAVQGSTVVVFASPTYKATYTGLLKLFLDQIPTDGLAGVVAVPLMLGAGPGHAMAPDLLLKPVLVELGATCPTRGLYLIDKAAADEGVLDPWLAAAAPQVAAAAREPVT